MKKIPFDISVAIPRIRKAVEPFPKAAMFELAEQGFDSPFEQLVACIISIRTLDEIMLPTARGLFDRARTAREILDLSIEEIDELIRPSTFHERKARQIREIARKVVEEHGGELPCDEAILLSLGGVGPKCANLVLGIAWYAVLLFSLTFHEAAHAFAALRGGDRTAYLGGQVSLDPTPHIRREPLGTVVFPIVIYLISGGGWMFGWASTPFDPRPLG